MCKEFAEWLTELRDVVRKFGIDSNEVIRRGIVRFANGEVDDDPVMWAIVYNVRIGEHEYGQEIRCWGTLEDALERAEKELETFWGEGETELQVFNDDDPDVGRFEAWDELRQRVAYISDVTRLTGTTAYLPDGREVLFDAFYSRRT